MYGLVRPNPSKGMPSHRPPPVTIYNTLACKLPSVAISINHCEHTLFIWGYLCDHLMYTKSFTFNNDSNIHTSFKNHEESGYGFNLDLVTISYYSRVSYPRRSG